MSKPSGRSRKSIRHPSMVRPPLAKTDPIAIELRKMLHDLLIGVRQWGLKLEAMTRQKYDPDSMVEATENFLQLYEFFAHVIERAALIEHPNPAQKELRNAAEILLFYQGPILEGCLNGTSAGETLDAFLASVNTVMANDEEDLPHVGSPAIPAADKARGAVEGEAPLHDEGAPHGEEEDKEV